jgi:hypothetical protein
VRTDDEDSKESGNESGGSQTHGKALSFSEIAGGPFASLFVRGEHAGRAPQNLAVPTSGILREF